MGSPNGGIIGVVNPTSFGKNTITTATSGSTTVTTQPGTRLIDYLVVAGGGAGGGATPSSVGGAGGGAGGYRASGFGPICSQGSTLNVEGNTSYPLVVGAGGAGVIACRGSNGSPSSFAAPSPFGITSTGGGGGGVRCATGPFTYVSSTCKVMGSPGGSGGGTGSGGPGYFTCSPGPTFDARGLGNTPPTSPPQGNNGGQVGQFSVEGGGGASADGGDTDGGDGYLNDITGSPTGYAGGGGAGNGGAGGLGGGGAGACGVGSGTAGTVNTGGGGGGSDGPSPPGLAGGAGGSGIVIVKELNKATGSWPLSAQFRSQKSGTWPKPSISVSFDYLVVAGGGGAGGNAGSGGAGGGGAGGYRTSFPGGTKISLTAFGQTDYPITVGGGGAGGTSTGCVYTKGTSGNPSIFSTITSAGGGGGGSGSGTPTNIGANGGSGGGGGYGPSTGGTGNTPPVSPSQGNPGGSTPGASRASSGGGGAGAAGGNGPASGGYPTGDDPAGAGGVGSPNIIYDSPTVGTPGPAPGRYYAGGGGGSVYTGTVGAGGAGGGAAGKSPSGGTGTAGTVNTGGGGGSGGAIAPGTGGAGGSGIVIVRAPGPAGPAISISPGTNTKTTLPAPAGGCTVAVFTVSGNLTLTP